MTKDGSGNCVCGEGTACGGGDNSIEGKQKTLAGLKKQALDLNAQIVALEKDLEKAGGAAAAKAILHPKHAVLSFVLNTPCHQSQRPATKQC